MTAIVRAVQGARGAVVNIQGQKTITEAAATRGGQETSRQVNGMGTGVVLDPRGYILTNHHVVDGVREINVSLDDGSAYIAQIVGRDPSTDLALIKIGASRMLPTIALGTSSDLLTGEPVIAMGNAYGYEHTVTRGIISALHRDVQVSDTQAYENLIQTDASINPGNSGGPLLNIDGKMVGVNVAVRAGAQGIGFAIPIDKALAVATEMISIERLENKTHGIAAAERLGDGQLLVRRVIAGSPADRAGIRTGDVITHIGELAIDRPLDLERALLGQRVGQELPLSIDRNGAPVETTIAVAMRGGRTVAASAPVTPASAAGRNYDREPSWNVIGVALEEEPSSTFAKIESRYRGGMRVVKVRPGSPAAKQGIQPGDILVGMHRWETSNAQDVRYIVSRAGTENLGDMKFYILRGQETLYGQINVASGTPTRR